MHENGSAVRVGLLGYGFAGKTFHAPLIQATSGLELVAVASSDAGKVHKDLPKVEVLADPHSLLDRDDIDVIVIASPNQTHAPLARRALLAGRHVVVDKPFALDLDEARSVAAMAERCGRMLSVFQNRRWDSDFLAVKKSIEDGLIGTVVHFESHIDRYRPHVRARWREKAGPGAGIWYDLGPHLVDQALQLFGLPERVSGHLAIQRRDGEVDDWAHALLDYGTLQVVLHASMLVAGGVSRFTVHGDKGSIVKRWPDQQEAQLLAGMLPGAAGWGADADPLVFYPGDGEAQSLPVAAGDQRRYYESLRDAIRGDAANPVPPIQAVAVMAVLDAVVTSQREQRSITLPLTAEERVAWQKQA